MENTRLFDLLPHYKTKFKPKPDVLAAKENGAWRTIDIDEYIENVDLISYGLMALGVEPGDRIGTITSNRPEWNYLDMAIMQVGAYHVPIYPTISQADYQYIFCHSEVKFLFVSGEDLANRVADTAAMCPHVREVFRFKANEKFRDLDAVIKLGRENPRPEKLEERKQAVKTHDIATIIYTSGTTGNPKGVMLSHNNIISNFVALSYIPQFGEEGKALSFLPLCHIYERMINYLYHYLGISIYYAESLGTITENINEIHPEMMCCVPRLLEKIYDKIQSSGRKLTGVKKNIFFWASDLALDFDVHGNNSAWYKAQHKIADKLVYSKWRQALGGNFQIIVTGGAAIQPRLVRTFRAAGLPVYEGYGLTETSPVVAVTSIDPNGLKIGTVGPPLRGVDVRIADDGEVLVKGPNVMLGYYKDPERTAEVIDADGWFHTGDVGVIEPEGQLRLTGRKKEIFKTSMGKYIAPELLENKVKESSFIDTIMVVGEGQKFAAALIIPDFAYLKSYARIKGFEYTTDAEMVKNPIIEQRILKEINKFNRDFGATEQIKKIKILGKEWSVGTGELTPTLKLKRAFINQKYKTEIDQLFN